jgi:phosphoglycolate phosphatase
MIKYLVWDFDDTLMNTVPVFVSAANEMLKKRGRPCLTVEEVSVYRGQTMEKILASFAPEEPVEELMKEFKEMDDKYQYKMSLKNNALNILKHTTERGYLNFLVSNRDHTFLMELLNKPDYDVKSYFKYIRGKKSTEEGKPSIKAFNILIDESKMSDIVDHKEFVMIGDSSSDIDFAYNSNFSNVYIIKNEYSSKEFNDRLIKLNIPCVNDLIELKQFFHGI